MLARLTPENQIQAIGSRLIRRASTRYRNVLPFLRLRIVSILKPHRDKVHTLTSDNGKEFSEYEQIAKDLNADFYFAHPYASWERGTNENTNGLIRQYFPKSRDFTTITQQEINHGMKRLNNRPRKRLGFLIPAQVFFKLGVVLQM